MIHHVVHFRTILTDKHRGMMCGKDQQKWLMSHAISELAAGLAKIDGAVTIQTRYVPERQHTEIDHRVTIYIPEDNDGTN